MVESLAVTENQEKVCGLGEIRLQRKSLVNSTKMRGSPHGYLVIVFVEVYKSPERDKLSLLEPDNPPKDFLGDCPHVAAQANINPQPQELH